jgi:hypothetical protein
VRHDREGDVKTLTESEILAPLGVLGIDVSRGLRFAVHEASHARDLWRLRCVSLRTWSTEPIHNAVLRRLSHSERIDSEARARAAEWLVLESMGEPYDVEHWAFVSACEAIKSGLVTPRPNALAALIRDMRESIYTKATVRALLRGKP